MRPLILAVIALTPAIALASPVRRTLPKTDTYCVMFSLAVRPGSAPNAAERARMWADFARFMAVAKTCDRAHPALPDQPTANEHPQSKIGVSK